MTLKSSKLKVFYETLDKMMSDDVLEKVFDDTDWEAPTFVVPKKNKAIRIVADFR